MPLIHITTFIEAPIDRVFDLARSITLHEKSMEGSSERAIAGVTSGLINLGDSVTWQAKHFLKKRTLKSRISAMTFPTFFEDVMIEGDFKSLRHEHHFKPIANGTIMIDLFKFEAPYGKIGEFANTVFLTRYLKKILTGRNTVIKNYAETEKWKTVLKETKTQHFVNT